MLACFFVCLFFNLVFKKNHLSSSYTLFSFDLFTLPLSLSLFIWHWWRIINQGNQACLTSARMSSPAESTCCFTFPLSHLPTHITTLLYCPSRCFSASTSCVCACVSHAHCHTPDLYNAPNALDTRLFGKVARECGLTAFKPHFHLHTHPPHITHTYIHTHTLIVVCAPITYLC